MMIGYYDILRWFDRKGLRGTSRLLASTVLQVRDLHCLKKAMRWTEDPMVDFEFLSDFEYEEDLNNRRVRDAEVVGAACANAPTGQHLEIGTALGQMTLVMARNAPHGIVTTVNLPPEDVAEAGTLITFAPSRDQIGRYFREAGCPNVVQILANTATWSPDLDRIDVALIDGCHDPQFVYQDTVKVLAKCRPGSIVLWHDFSPGLSARYPAIDSVCRSVAKLISHGYIKGPILHVRDSFVGLYRVQ